MRKLGIIAVGVLVASWVGSSGASAEAPVDQEVAEAKLAAVQAAGEYPVLNRGRVVVVNARQLVVTQEPNPVAIITRAPPPLQATPVERPHLPYQGAIWVESHWAYGAAGFDWVAGRYIAPRSGHVFVPPRWALVDQQYLYFNGFYVPYGVYVRSYFNRYYYSGSISSVGSSKYGPYWPVGAPSLVPGAASSGRNPYWPVGAPR